MELAIEFDVNTELNKVHVVWRTFAAPIVQLIDFAVVDLFHIAMQNFK